MEGVLDVPGDMVDSNLHLPLIIIVVVAFLLFTHIVWAHELTGDKLRLREVVPIDISNDPVKTADYKPDEDPSKFKSVKTGRGPLQGPEWWKKCDPVMTCYKLVTCEFKWFGLQTRVEKFIQDVERRLFTNFHRLRGQMPCFLKSFMANRVFQVRVGTSLSRSVHQMEGIPQGSFECDPNAIAINGVTQYLSSGI
ncbi:Phosphatidylinositol transfer protein alpha isoform-like 1 [Homarus americanus]|uniref:Phosphatidylinositol transfer protein alpha isoform-like 1 n=1 Tax=Homarus americanus TaxID=6706 RepID=A0A8J5JZ95_HOMAM|nr:Phosphatidylinositol transfer protein alpha isoform-like 1 [Homarus americanus]